MKPKKYLLLLTLIVFASFVSAFVHNTLTDGTTIGNFTVNDTDQIQKLIRITRFVEYENSSITFNFPIEAQNLSEFNFSIGDTNILNLDYKGTYASPYFTPPYLQNNSLNDNGLLAYWIMDKVGATSNEIQSGFDATLTSVDPITGYNMGALRFNDSGSIASFASITLTQNYTITAWINYNNTVSQPIIGSTSFLNSFRTDQSGRLMIGTSNTTANNVSATTTIPTDTWTFVAVVVNNNTPTFYLNATVDPVTSGTLTGNLVLNRFNPNGAISITDGILDEVKIWRRSLSAQEIEDLYLNKTTFYSGIDNALDSVIIDCDCNGCTTVGDNVCEVPLNFTSNASTPIQTEYSNINFQYEFQLNNCTLGNVTANFTYLDEENESSIFADYSYTFDYEFNGQVGSYSNQQDNVSFFEICLHPSFTPLNVNYSILSDGDAYQQRRYANFDQLFNNVTIHERNIYMLPTAEGIFIRFSVTSAFHRPLSDVDVLMERDYSGTDEQVERRETDDAGIATFWVDPDTEYTFTFTLEGFQTQSFTLRPTTSEIIDVTLVSDTAVINNTYSTGFVFDYSPQGQVLNNNTLYNFTITVNSTFWNLTQCNISISNTTTTLSTIVGTNDGDVCNGTIEHNTGTDTRLFTKVVYQLNNSVILEKSFGYAVRSIYTGTYSLRVWIDDVNNFTAAGFDDFSRMLIGIILIVLVTGALAQKTRIVREPEAITTLIIVQVFILSYIGWFTLNYAPITALNIIGLNQYFIFYLTLLGGGGFILARIQQ